MGISILELVLDKLREAGFTADMAFPGRKYPVITGPVAAVHIEKVDRADLTVTVEVSILCPAALGGTHCELEALRATETLQSAGAACIQNGCRYDGMAQAYAVSILAVFTCVSGAGDCTLGPGFRIYLQDEQIPFVISFHSVQNTGAKAVYELGENIPAGFLEGEGLWEFTLEEQIPPGESEGEDPGSPFTLRLESGTVTESYLQCCWTSHRREFTRQGLRRIRTAISMERQEG